MLFVKLPYFLKEFDSYACCPVSKEGPIFWDRKDLVRHRKFVAQRGNAWYRNHASKAGQFETSKLFGLLPGFYC